MTSHLFKQHLTVSQNIVSKRLSCFPNAGPLAPARYTSAFLQTQNASSGAEVYQRDVRFYQTFIKQRLVCSIFVQPSLEPFCPLSRGDNSCLSSSSSSSSSFLFRLQGFFPSQKTKWVKYKSFHKDRIICCSDLNMPRQTSKTRPFFCMKLLFITTLAFSHRPRRHFI